MYPFDINPYAAFGFPRFPFGPGPVIPRRRNYLKRLEIFELPTMGVQLSATSVDYGINPCVYAQLPCECYVTLRIRQAVPAGGAALPVSVVVPTAGSSKSTVTTPGSTSGTKKVTVVDHTGGNVVGADVTEFTDVLALVDKSLGIIRFVNFVSGGTPAADAGGNTPASASVKSAKANS